MWYAKESSDYFLAGLGAKKTKAQQQAEAEANRQAAEAKRQANLIAKGKAEAAAADAARFQAAEAKRQEAARAQAQRQADASAAQAQRQAEAAAKQQAAQTAQAARQAEAKAAQTKRQSDAQAAQAARQLEAQHRQEAVKAAQATRQTESKAKQAERQATAQQKQQTRTDAAKQKKVEQEAAKVARKDAAAAKKEAHDHAVEAKKATTAAKTAGKKAPPVTPAQKAQDDAKLKQLQALATAHKAELAKGKAKVAELQKTLALKKAKKKAPPLRPGIMPAKPISIKGLGFLMGLAKHDHRARRALNGLGMLEYRGLGALGEDFSFDPNATGDYFPGGVGVNTGPFGQTLPGSTGIDPNLYNLINPPAPAAPAIAPPKGYERRVARGNLKPVDLYYQMSLQAQQQNAALLTIIVTLEQQISQINDQIASLIQQIADAGTGQDFGPQVIGYDVNGNPIYAGQPDSSLQPMPDIYGPGGGEIGPGPSMPSGGGTLEPAGGGMFETGGDGMPMAYTGGEGAGISPTSQSGPLSPTSGGSIPSGGDGGGGPMPVFPSEVDSGDSEGLYAQGSPEETPLPPMTSRTMLPDTQQPFMPVFPQESNNVPPMPVQMTPEQMPEEDTGEEPAVLEESQAPFGADSELSYAGNPGGYEGLDGLGARRKLVLKSPTKRPHVMKRRRKLNGLGKHHHHHGGGGRGGFWALPAPSYGDVIVLAPSIDEEEWDLEPLPVRPDRG